MTESRDFLVETVAQALQPTFRGELLARGVARGLIWQDGSVPDEAPNFADTLTSDLTDYAHALLSMALRLRGAEGLDDLARAALRVAGESIEAAVHRGEYRQDIGTLRVTGSIALHLSRHSAQAFSLLPSSPDSLNLSPSEHALYLILRRDLVALKSLTGSWLTDQANRASAITQRLEDDPEFASDDAIHLILTSSLMRSVMYLDASISSGRPTGFDSSLQILGEAQALASDAGNVPHWWTCSLALHLLDDLWSSSLHVSIPDLPPDDRDHVTWSVLRRKYIQRLRCQPRATIEIWPSQTEGVHRSVDQDDSLVIAMPTSAGKTRVAELCILRSLASGRRALFVTPLRALSAQTERDLSETFRPLGYRVTSLYGSAGIEAADMQTLGNTPIVVSTPEKLDFALRNNPGLLDDVGVVVLDEGHMLGPGEREVRYEALIQRLIRRSDAPARRLVCLSAMFPRPDSMVDFVGWIRRDAPGDAVWSDWRPTRQRFGWLMWKGSSARLDLEMAQGTQTPFVPRFVSETAAPHGSRRRKPFPSDKNELTIAASLQFLRQGRDVLIYNPLRGSVETLGRALLRCLRQRVIALPSTTDRQILATIKVGEEWLGVSHPAVQSLAFGVALHHAGLPRPFLAQVERLLNEGRCRIVIASPTVAQGLNLKASVVLIPSLWRRRSLIPPAELANVAGRAGRAFTDLEGLVVHVVWDTGRKGLRQIRQWRGLAGSSRTITLASGLLTLVRKLCLQLAEAKGLDVVETFDFLIGRSDAWDLGHAGIDESQWIRDLDSLDSAILSLADLDVAAENLADHMSDVLKGSLYSRQLSNLSEGIAKLASSFIEVRAKFVWLTTTDQQRRAYHLSGVGLLGGRAIEAQSEELIRILLKAETAIHDGSHQDAATAIAEVAPLVLEHHPFRPYRVPDTWENAVEAWLLGSPMHAVLATLGEHGVDALQDGVIYRLAWALEAVRVHGIAIGNILAHDLEGTAAIAVETGTVDRPAAVMLQAGLASRLAAIAASVTTGAAFFDQRGMVEWLRSDEVRERSLDPSWPVPEGRSAWLQFLRSGSVNRDQTWQWLDVETNVTWDTHPPPSGTPVSLIPRADGTEWTVFPVGYPEIAGRAPRPSDLEEIRVADAYLTTDNPNRLEVQTYGPVA